MWPAIQIVRCAQNAARSVVNHTCITTAPRAHARAAVVGELLGRRHRCTASAAVSPVLVDITDNGLFASVTLNRWVMLIPFITPLYTNLHLLACCSPAHFNGHFRNFESFNIPHAHHAPRRPDKHNALSPATMDGLVEAFGKLGTNDDLRGVFLKAAGATFCAGVKAPLHSLDL